MATIEAILKVIALQQAPIRHRRELIVGLLQAMEQKSGPLAQGTATPHQVYRAIYAGHRPLTKRNCERIARAESVRGVYHSAFVQYRWQLATKCVRSPSVDRFLALVSDVNNTTYDWKAPHHNLDLHANEKALDQLATSLVNFQGWTVGCIDLPRQPLGGLNFSYGDFSGRGNYERASFYKANLRGSSYYKANLNETDMRHANLRETSFRGARMADVDLREADARCASFVWASLDRSNFERTDLRGAKFTDADLRGANFRFAKIEGADFRAAIRNEDDAPIRGWFVRNGTLHADPR